MAAPVEPVSQDVERLRRQATDMQLDRLAKESEGQGEPVATPDTLEDAYREVFAPQPVYANTPKERLSGEAQTAVEQWKDQLEILDQGAKQAGIVPQAQDLYKAIGAWRSGMDSPMRSMALRATEMKDANLAKAVGRFLPTSVPFQYLSDDARAQIAPYYNDQMLFEALKRENPNVPDDQINQTLGQLQHERDAYSQSPYGEGAKEWADANAEAYEKTGPTVLRNVARAIPVIGAPVVAGLEQQRLVEGGMPNGPLFFDLALASAPLGARGAGQVLKASIGQEVARFGMEEAAPRAQNAIENLGAPHAVGVATNLIVALGSGAFAAGLGGRGLFARQFTAGFIPQYPELAATIADDKIPWEDRVAAAGMSAFPLTAFGTALLARGINSGLNLAAEFRTGDYQLRSSRIPDAYVATAKTPWTWHGTALENIESLLRDGPNTPGFWSTSNIKQAYQHGDTLTQVRPALGSRMLRDGPAAREIFHQAAVRIEAERAELRAQGLDMTTRRSDEIYAETIRSHGFDGVDAGNGHIFMANTGRVEFRDLSARPVTAQTVRDAVQAKVEQMIRVATPEELPVNAGGSGPDSAIGRLPPLMEQVANVETSNNFVIRNLSRLINPSILRNTILGKIMTAFARQTVAKEELVKVALATAFDSHAQRFTARMGHIWSVDRAGALRDVTAKRPGASLDMYDVLEHPERYNFKHAETRALADDIRNMIRDMDVQRRDAGLPALSKTIKIPRGVADVGGVQPGRPTDSHLSRTYDYAAEGRSHGVNYETNIRAVLEAHLRAHYDEIIDKQLADALIEASADPSGPLSILPRDLVPTLVRERTVHASAELSLAERAVARAQRELMAEGFTNHVIPEARDALRAVTIDASEAGRTLDLLTRRRQIRRQQLLEELRDAQDIQRKAKTAAQAAGRQYSTALQLAKKETLAPAHLFGRGEGMISIKMWRNRFILKEDYVHLEEGLRKLAGMPEQAHILSRAFNTLGNAVRYLSAGFDLALPFIHGLTVLGENPVAWAKGSLLHYEAILDPTVQFRYIKDNLVTFKEMAANGVAIGDPEFFAFLREGGGANIGMLTRYMPKGESFRRVLQAGGQQSFGRFQAAFNTGLGVYRAELWKALKPGWKGTTEELAATVRNLTGALDSRALGVDRNQRGLESMWLAFSPRLLRSTVALVADLRNPLSPRGRAAFHSLAGLTSAAVGIYTLTGLALGKSWDEIGNGLNPLAGKKFLAHEVNGDWIGVGGQMRAIAQLLARSAASINHPEVWLSMNSQENPIFGAYMARGAVGVHMAGIAGEAVTGGQMNILPFEEIDNPGDAVKQLATSALPFTIQGHLMGENWLTSGAAFVGARTQPERWYEQRTALVQQEYRVKDWAYLTSAERQEFYDRHPDLKQKSEDSVVMAAKHGERWALRVQEREEANLQYFKLLESVEGASVEEQKDLLASARFKLSADLAAVDQKYADVVEDLDNERRDNPPKTRADELLAQRNAIFSRYTNPETGQPNDAVAREQLFNELDSWESALSSDDQALVDENTGLRQMPQWLENYRTDLRTLQPYFKALDRTWSSNFIDGADAITLLNGAVTSKYATPGDFQLRKPVELAEQFRTQGLGAWGELQTEGKKSPTYAEKYGAQLATNPQLANELAAKFVDMALAEFYSARASSAYAWLATRPELAKLLAKWKLSVASSQSQDFLAILAGDSQGATEEQAPLPTTRP